VIKRILTNWRIENQHPAEERLLASVDGELSNRQTTRTRQHLESCWPCRANLDRMQETISLFVEFQDQILQPATPPPPGNWTGFSERLKGVEAVYAAEPKSSWSGIAHLWDNFTAAVRPSNWSGGFIQGLSGSIAALVIVAFIWQLIAVSAVTANVLLENALRSERTAVEAVQQPVVYRKLRVLRPGREAFDWEVWRDVAHGRYRQSSPGVVDLESILGSNRMDAFEPLSAESFHSWRDTLKNKTDNVDRITGANGEKYLALTTINNSIVEPGGISQARVNVRESDWHPVSEELRVKNNGTEETYSLTELEFRVVTLSSLKPDFFDNAITRQIAEVAPSPIVSPETSLESEANTSVPPAASGAAVSPATAEDEIEVLQLLNQAKADLGEQITVTRQNGLLYIRGVVETAERKKEILAALASKANNPAIKIEIETNAEALARVAKQRSNSKVETITGDDTSASATEDELVKRFGSQAAARAFSTQMINRSRGALSHAYALKRLAGHFSASELREMKPDARAKWLELIAQHAGAFRTETASLRGELQDVFDGQGGGAGAVPTVNDWTDVPAAATRLAELASTNDAIIRSAFAVSSGGAQVSAVKTARFWQSLRAAEALAGRLQAVK
jgi:hypothetical protein